MILCTISQSTYFAASYSGSLDRLLDRIELDDASATYCRKVAVICTSIAWAMYFGNVLFMAYSFFCTGGYMDIILAPITIHVNLSHQLIPRIAVYLFSLYFTAAWTFPHAMSFMLATVFTRQYRTLGRSFDRMLAESDERRLSDSDIEQFRQRHNEISALVSETDDFLMFHNAGAFCCQLFDSILHFYDLIFFHGDTNDAVVIKMRVFWMFGVSAGLAVTTAAGIMLNHYVSTDTNNMMHAQL